MIPFFDASQRQKFKTTAKKCNFFIAFAKTMFSLGESYVFTLSKLCFYLVNPMFLPRQSYVFTLLMHSINSVYTRLQFSKSRISCTWR